MTIVVWMVATLSTALLGLVGTGVVTMAYTQWYRVSTFEGGAGYLVLIMAALGGVAGLLLGAVVSALALADGGRFGGWYACVLAWGIALALLGVAACGLRIFADIPPTMDGHRVRLEVEFRLPAGQAFPTPTADKHPWIILVSDLYGVRRSQMYGQFRPEQARLEEGRWIVPAEVDVHTHRGRLHLHPQWLDTDGMRYALTMPRRPAAAHEAWSEWLPRGKPEAPWPAERITYRTRLVPQRPPPPGPTREERERSALEAERARFEALEPNAPLQALLPFLEGSTSPEVRSRAVEALHSRTNLSHDLRALIMDEDANTGAAALSAIKDLREPRDAIVSLVLDAGRDIATRIERLNEVSIAEDPSFLGAMDASIRFSAWIDVLRALRGRGTEIGVEELARILELSRVREESHAMQTDIRRVASFYLHEWAGVAPLPGDPPARRN